MFTERYDKERDTNENDVFYFKSYSNFIAPQCYGDVVEIGCGEGWLTKMIAENKDVNSIDAYDRFGEQPDCNKDDKITYIQRDITRTDFTGQYDCIVSAEFIEHITEKDLEILLDKLYRVLKDDGIFIGSTPNVSCLNPENSYHIREYNTDELIKIFDKHGFVGIVDNTAISFLSCFKFHKK